MKVDEFIKLYQKCEEPMTEPRCENCRWWGNVKLDGWGDARMCKAQRLEQEILGIVHPMLTAKWGQCKLYEPIPTPIPQHSEDDWFAAFGRFIHAAHSGPLGIATSESCRIVSQFNAGDRSQSLWRLMQQAVNNA